MTLIPEGTYTITKILGRRKVELDGQHEFFLPAYHYPNAAPGDVITLKWFPRIVIKHQLEVEG